MLPDRDSLRTRAMLSTYMIRLSSQNTTLQQQQQQQQQSLSGGGGSNIDQHM
jgi:hypothetical protein